MNKRFALLKKAVAAVLSVGLLLGLAACGTVSASQTPDAGSTPASHTSQTSAEANDAGEITFWCNTYGDRAVQEQLLKELTEQFYEESGIRVRYSIIDWDQSLTKMTLACTGGEAPDVYDIYFTSSLLAMGDEKCGLAPIDDVIADLGEDQYSEAGRTESFQNGHWYGLPWRADTRVMLYNKEFFADADITEFPTTWDELFDAAEKLTVRDANGNLERSGLLWNVGNGRFDQTWRCLLAGAGGSILDETYSRANFNSPAGVESLGLMRAAIDEYGVMPATCIDPSFDPVAEFMAGKAAMVMGVGASTRQNIINMAPQMEDAIGAALIPSKDGTGNSSVASAASFAAMKGPNLEEAKEFLRFLGRKDIMTKWAITLNMLNCSSEIMSDPYFSEDEWLRVFAQQMNRAGNMDEPVPQFSQIDAWPNGPVPKMVTDVMAGVDVETALAEGELAVNELLGAG